MPNCISCYSSCLDQPQSDARGKLNARELVGGKKTLRQMQTDFARNVGQPFGLERARSAAGPPIRRSKPTTGGPTPPWMPISASQGAAEGPFWVWAGRVTRNGRNGPHRPPQSVWRTLRPI